MKKFAVIFIIVLVIVSNFACAPDNLEEPSAIQIMNQRIAELAELDNLANEFFIEDVFLNTLIYIRGGRYDDVTWNLLAGESSADFEQYVIQNSELNSEALRSIPDIIIPSTGDVVDFVHMVATMNMALKGKSKSDLGGFAGDITQLVTDIKHVEGDFETVYNAAKLQFGMPGGFDYPDVYANIDAVNMVAEYNENQELGFSEIFADYYENLTQELRIDKYFINEFGTNEFDLDTLRSEVYNRVIDNYYISLIFIKDGISSTVYANHIKACSYVYADYLFEYIDDEQNL